MHIAENDTKCYCGQIIYPKTTVKSVKDSNCFYCISAWEKAQATRKPIQAQESLFDQLKKLIILANQSGLYDAADYLVKVTEQIKAD